jgi:hypothetical protein
MQFLEISWDFWILGFSKILGFFQRFFWIFDEVYEDFQSSLPLAWVCPRLDDILRACCTRDLSVMRLLEFARLVRVF